jgi:hypothetical protein
MPIPIRIRIDTLMTIQIRIRIRIGNKNDADPHADPLPQILHMLQNHNIFFTFSQNITGLKFFVFLISVKCAIIFGIFDRIVKFLEKSLVYHFFHFLGLDTDPDRHA